VSDPRLHLERSLLHERELRASARAWHARSLPRRRPGRLAGRLLSILGTANRQMRDDPDKEAAVKYMMLINLGERVRDYANLSEEEQKLLASGFQSINQTQGVTPGTRLQPPETATTVRVRDGRTITTDGPFVETKEALDGYCTFEADDLDAAIELASRMPAASMGGAIEIRPIAEW